MCQQASAAPPSQFIESAAPAGFEALEDDPLMMVDVFWGGLELGAFEARYESDTVTFASPEHILEKMTTIRSRKEVLRALSGPLPANETLVCVGEGHIGCGRLEPDIVGVIFSRQKFEVTIFVAPAFLGSAGKRDATYLDDPSSSFSLMGRLRGSVTGNDRSSPTALLTSDAWLTLDRTRLETSVRASTQGRTEPDRLLLTHDLPGARLGLGLYRPDRTTYLAPRKLVGATLVSTEDTLLNPRALLSNPLPVLLVERAEVKVTLEGRTLYRAILDPGRHIIRTDSFPLGAYFVTVSARPILGGPTTEEERFIVRSRLMPLAGRIAYALDAGVSLDEETPMFHAHGGAGFRLLPWLGASADIWAREDSLVAELSMIAEIANLRVSAAGFLTDGLDAGAQLTVAGRYERFNYQVTARHVARPGNAGLTRQLPSSSTWVSAVVLGAVGPVTASGLLNYIRVGGKDHFNLGLQANASLFRSDLFTLGTNVGVGWDLKEVDARVMLTGRLNFGYVHSTQRIGLEMDDLNGAKGGPAVSPNAKVGVAFRDGDLAPDNYTARANIRHTRNLSETGVGAGYRGRLGDISGSVDHRFRGNGQGTRFQASMSVSATVDEQGIVVGGSRGGDAAVVIHANRNPAIPEVAFSNVRLRIEIIDQQGRLIQLGGERLVVAPGDQTVVYVPAYRTYTVRLIPEDGGLVDTDMTPRTVTLYRGNIQTLSWEITPKVALSGTVLRPNGAPVASALVYGADQVVGQTDEDGFFLVEIPRGQELSVRTRSWDPLRCEASIRPSSAKEGFYSLGYLRCIPPL